MCAALVLLVASHEVAAVITNEGEDCVVREVLLFKYLANATDRVINRLNAKAVVIRQLRLPGSRKGRGDPQGRLS